MLLVLSLPAVVVGEPGASRIRGLLPGLHHLQAGDQTTLRALLLCTKQQNKDPALGKLRLHL